MRIINVWAPPGMIWGPWIEIDAVCGESIVSYKISFETESNVKSTFEAEIQYWFFNEHKVDTVIGPGTHRFGLGMSCAPIRLRLRSFTVGQNVRVTF
jgi:hypothetical protein